MKRFKAAGYRVMASYVKRLHDAGVPLNIGTDMPDPGKAVLSEMLLLHDAGIPMTDVFRRIAVVRHPGPLEARAPRGKSSSGAVTTR